MAIREAVARYLPKRIVLILSDLICSIRDISDSLLRRKSALTAPCRLRMIVGGFKDARFYEEVGQGIIRDCIALGGLSPENDVLDVGCGCGKQAAPLVGYLNAKSKYVGFDIVPALIDWCTDNISSKYPNFHFQLADVYNKQYNPKGKYRASEYRFPYDNDSFDFVILGSVFTHMLPPDMENYLKEIARVLRRTGTSYITYFLLNSDTIPLVESGSAALNFAHQFGIFRSISLDIPEAGLAYDESFVLGLYRKYGLEVNQILYGTWSKTRVQHQDVIIATKK